MAAGNTTTLNVTNFGANGSDQLDDTKQLQQALDAAKGDDYTTIIVPDGVYLTTTSLKINSNTHLVLSDHAVIKRNGVFGPMLRNKTGGPGYTGNQNIVIEGGTWDGNGAILSGNITYDNLEFGHASNITVQNTNVINDYGAHAIEFVGVQNGQVLNSHISGYYHGSNFLKKEAIQLDITHSSTVSFPFGYYDDTPSKDITIQGNTIENYSRGVGSHTTVKGVYPEGITIQNNVFKNLTDEAIDALDYKNLSILNNSFENVGSGVDFTTVTSNPGANYTPNDTASPINIENQFSIKIIGNKMTNVRTIPHRQVGNGIRLSGTPDHPIKGVTIQNNSINGCDQDGIHLDYTSQTTITGNHVEGNKSYGLGVHYYSTSNMVDNNTFSGNGDHGISVYRNSNASITNNSIHNNKGSGISITSSSSGNKVDKNNIAYNGNYGVALYDASNQNVISNNAITHTKYGIGVNSKSNHNQIDHNSVSHSSSMGVRLYGTTKAPVLSNTVTSNTIDTSSSDGIHLEHASSTGISGNTITHSNRNGLSIYNHSNAKVTSNKIYSNKAIGISISSYSNSSLVQKNTIKDSGTNGVSIGSSSSRNTFDSNSILNSRNYGFGIYSGSTKNTIKNNTITNSIRGIQLVGTKSKQLKSNTVTKNTIKSSKREGIYLVYASGNTVSANTITSSGSSGISINKYSQKNSVSLNKLDKSKKQGILVFDHSSATIIKNVVSHSTENGLAISQFSTKSSISGNKITDSNRYGISLSKHSRTNSIVHNTILKSKKGKMLIA
ncbi:MAG TPA: right-handed parallel beta-helix repeat-containing protein [Candidatus Angelobacter sp.]|nr:right-handed parallel beta-helix repeat-containing protein [Candidatus Angelobacter sp.]